MEFFGLDGEKLLVIAVVAFVVLGPEKLPEAMAQLGKAYRDIRRLTGGLSEEFAKVAAEARDLTRSAADGPGGMQAQVATVAEGVKRDLASTGVAAPRARPPATTDAERAAALERARRRRRAAGYTRRSA